MNAENEQVIFENIIALARKIDRKMRRPNHFGGYVLSASIFFSPSEEFEISFINVQRAESADAVKFKIKKYAKKSTDRKNFIDSNTYATADITVEKDKIRAIYNGRSPWMVFPRLNHQDVLYILKETWASIR